MKNYADMSDHDINAAVASSLGVDFEMHETGVYASVKWDGDNVVSVVGIVDYCNNWADAGPVMLENSITLNYDTAQVHVSSYFNESIKVSTNRSKALRAAMIVFLMMKDNETRILAPDEVSDA